MRCGECKQEMRKGDRMGLHTIWTCVNPHCPRTDEKQNFSPVGEDDFVPYCKIKEGESHA